MTERRELIAFAAVIAGAAGNVPLIVNGPCEVRGIFRDLADTLPAATLGQPIIAPRGESPANPLTWSGGVGVNGPAFDPANPGGRFAFGLQLREGQSLTMAFTAAGIGGIAQGFLEKITEV